MVATTGTDWRDKLKAVQPSKEGEVRYDTGTPDGRVLAEEENKTVSDMLTVWRTIHLELDAMEAPPPDELLPGDPSYAERNFIRGRVIAISGAGRPPTRIDLLGETAPPGPSLFDRSLRLDGADAEKGNGRFEKGTIRLGLDAKAVVVSQLDGNGTLFVAKQAGMDIPAELRDAQDGNALTRKILGWDAATRLFTLSADVPAGVYDNGNMSLGGVEWTIMTTNGSQATVVEDQLLPFFLVDDDTVKEALGLDPSMIQASDDPTANLLAQAYIRPAYELPNPTPLVRFKRNVTEPLIIPPDIRDTREADAQIARGRDAPSGSASYWIGYMQAAYQGDERRDIDPGAEFPSDQGITGPDAGFVFSEVIADQARRNFGDDFAAEATKRCLRVTLAHEVGHQLDADHADGGIMGGQNCAEVFQFFTGRSLDAMRSKGVAR